MSYIGSAPTTQSFISGTDFLSGTGSQTQYSLSRIVNTVNDIEIFVSNVAQDPSSYSVTYNILTFSGAPPTGTNNIYVRYLSTTLQAYNPTQGSVLPTTLSSGGPTWDSTKVLISTTTSATSTASGALQVRGGAGIIGNTYSYGFYTTNGIFWAGNGVAFSSAPGGSSNQIQFNLNNSFTGTANLIYDSTTGNIVIGSSTAATSTTTGALVVAGGIGVASSIQIGQDGSGVSVNATGNLTTSSYVVGGTIQGSTVKGTSQVADANGNLRFIPQSGAADKNSSPYTLVLTDVGQYVSIGGGSIAIPTGVFSTGSVVTLYNNTGSGISITCSALTTYVSGSSATRSSLILASRGLATILFTGSSSCVISGSVS